MEYRTDPLHEEYDVVNIFEHEEFARTMKIADIGLLELNKDVVLKKRGQDGQTVTVTRIPDISRKRVGVGIICELGRF